MIIDYTFFLYIRSGEVNNLIKQDTEDLNSKLKSSLNKIVSLE